MQLFHSQTFKALTKILLLSLILFFDSLKAIRPRLKRKENNPSVFQGRKCALVENTDTAIIGGSGGPRLVKYILGQKPNDPKFLEKHFSSFFWIKEVIPIGKKLCVLGTSRGPAVYNHLTDEIVFEKFYLKEFYVGVAHIQFTDMMASIPMGEPGSFFLDNFIEGTAVRNETNLENVPGNVQYILKKPESNLVLYGGEQDFVSAIDYTSFNTATNLLTKRFPGGFIEGIYSIHPGRNSDEILFSTFSEIFVEGNEITGIAIDDHNLGTTKKDSMQVIRESPIVFVAEQISGSLYLYDLETKRFNTIDFGIWTNIRYFCFNPRKDLLSGNIWNQDFKVYQFDKLKCNVEGCKSCRYKENYCSTCEEPSVLQEGVCLEECVGKKVLDLDLNQCVDYCPRGLEKLSGRCKINCEPEKPYIEGKICVKKCSAERGLVNGVFCDFCADPVPYLDEGICVSQCPIGKVPEGSKCIKCPEGQSINLEGGCSSCSPSCKTCDPFDFQKCLSCKEGSILGRGFNCIDCLALGPSSLPSIKTGTCVDCYDDYDLDPELCSDAIELMRDLKRSVVYESEGKKMTFFIKIGVFNQKNSFLFSKIKDWNQIIKTKAKLVFWNSSYKNSNKRSLKTLENISVFYSYVGKSLLQVSMEGLEPGRVRTIVSIEPVLKTFSIDNEILVFKKIPLRIAYNFKKGPTEAVVNFIEQVEPAAKTASTGAPLIAMIFSFIFPSILGYLVGLFQSIDIFYMLSLLNIHFGESMTRIAQFLGELNFFSSIPDDTWVKNYDSMKKEYIIGTSEKMRAEFNGGFVLVEEPIKPLIFLVSLPLIRCFLACRIFFGELILIQKFQKEIMKIFYGKKF